MDLLQARKDTRKKIKYKTIVKQNGDDMFGLLSEEEDKYILKRVEGEVFDVDKNDVVEIKDSYNEFEKAVLDGLQLAYKVTCNSVYGQVGATTSPICYKELAACTTATGRKMVTMARDITLENFPGCTLTYGDTDSIFVNFKGYLHNQYGTDLTEKDLLENIFKNKIRPWL